MHRVLMCAGLAVCLASPAAAQGDHAVWVGWVIPGFDLGVVALESTSESGVTLSTDLMFDDEGGLLGVSLLWGIPDGSTKIFEPYVGIGGAALFAGGVGLLGVWRLGIEVPIVKRIAARLEGRGFALPGALSPLIPVLAFRVR